MTQNEQVLTYLRGTGRELSAAQAKTRFGIKNLSARMSDLREGGFRVRTRTNSTGKTAYAVSRRRLFV
jgi:hypothetical protein